jgi:OOP family OmpA-OmpF porin
MRTATRLAAIAILLGGLGVTATQNRGKAEQAVDDAPRLPEQPGFEFSWMRGELHLSGHTISTVHEANLLDVAAAAFPDQRLVTDFKPLGLVPRYWEDTTLQVLYSLARTTSAQATLTRDYLSIRGVAIDAIGWHSRYEALRNSLPDVIEVSANTIIVDTDIDPTLACNRSFTTFVGGRINFAESGAVFLSSAYPRLARIAALADACRDSVVSITGHTDNTGAESWNRQLSRERAQAVADYLVDSGIDRDRLQIVASGSSEPLFENDTRYRRSLNRRIEIVLSATTPRRSD